MAEPLRAARELITSASIVAHRNPFSEWFENSANFFAGKKNETTGERVTPLVAVRLAGWTFAAGASLGLITRTTRYLHELYSPTIDAPAPSFFDESGSTFRTIVNDGAKPLSYAANYAWGNLEQVAAAYFLLKLYGRLRNHGKLSGDVENAQNRINRTENMAHVVFTDIPDLTILSATARSFGIDPDTTENLKEVVSVAILERYYRIDLHDLAGRDIEAELRNKIRIDLAESRANLLEARAKVPNTLENLLFTAKKYIWAFYGIANLREIYEAVSNAIQKTGITTRGDELDVLHLVVYPAVVLGFIHYFQGRAEERKLCRLKDESARATAELEAAE